MYLTVPMIAYVRPAVKSSGGLVKTSLPPLQECSTSPLWSVVLMMTSYHVTSISLYILAVLVTYHSP